MNIIQRVELSLGEKEYDIIRKRIIQHDLIRMKVGMGMQNINDLFEAYIAEEDPIKKEILLNMYNHALQQKQKEVISRDYFVR